ncbi:glycosyltransferase [Sphingobium sp. AR-3-1]|uniref:Glycosyltransferase n=1 Tax=Sphingobium psychrophilum TaxID=2728834 RepID=A0A7X9WZM0_9SPHN|nr:glycosyltransferase [Sphingobium psychrophilum]NML12767.1 glycosyltransferase [Sphingobium psychrophilum]
MNNMSNLPANPRYSVALFNSSDVRGKKVGGIQTYMRDYIEYHPEDMDLLVVGGDESGELPLGEISEVKFRDRKFKFLPLFHLTEVTPTYKGIGNSDTFKFAKLIIQNFGKIKKILKEGNYTVEIRRVEYAPIFKAMGVPVITMMHIWGRKDQKMSSVLGKYWWIRDMNEYLAAATSVKMYGVSTPMTEMFKTKYKRFINKFDVLTTWANPKIFKPTPYQFDEDDTIHLMYAGRLDKFKRPDFMFSVIAALDRQTGGKVRFHYVGDWDMTVWPEFSAVEHLVIREGVLTSEQIGKLLEEMHIGLLTSDFEGMPCIVMETLSSGRPEVARHLPQLEDVIYDGVTGYLIKDGPDQIEEQARRIVEIYSKMKDGSITPETVSKAVEPFGLVQLLSKIWNDHRVLHDLPRIPLAGVLDPVVERHAAKPASAA